MTAERRDGIGLRHAWNGVRIAWQTTPNLRIETAAFVAAVVVARWVDVSLVPVVLVSAIVIVSEIVNTSIERVVDLVSPHLQDGAGRAKDLAAGAVLTASAFAVLVGVIHLGPAVLDRLS